MCSVPGEMYKSKIKCAKLILRYLGHSKILSTFEKEQIIYTKILSADGSYTSKMLL